MYGNSCADYGKQNWCTGANYVYTYSSDYETIGYDLYDAALDGFNGGYCKECGCDPYEKNTVPQVIRILNFTDRF